MLSLRPRSRQRHPSSGFTLVELLTVIAIIGILAGILIPVAGRVRETAKASHCASNLRQIGQVFIAFATDHKDHYPLSWAKGRGVYDNNWPYNVAPYVGLIVQPSWEGAKAACNPKGPLGCPSAIGVDLSTTLEISYKMTARHRNYLENTLHKDPKEINPVGLAMSYIRTPSQSLLITDGRTGNPDFNSSDPTMFDGVSYPHRDRTNALFADGHVKAFSQQEIVNRWSVIYTQSVGN